MVKNFLPETGTLIAFEEDLNAEARWDSGVESGSVVGTSFDPMLAKVISYGATRTDAASKLARALEAAHIGGLTTNRDFLVATLKTQEFLNGDTTTDFIDRVKPPKELTLDENELEYAATIAALWMQELNRFNDDVLGHLPSGWTNGRIPKQNIRFQFKENEINITYKAQRDASFIVNNSKPALIHECYENGIDMEYNGRRQFSKVTIHKNKVLVHMSFGDVLLKIMPRFVAPGLEVQAGGLVAPMPGKVINLNVKKGSKVKTGDTLVILEAMKMEHSIKAAEDGIISELYVSNNDQVENGALLMVIDSN